MNFSEVLDELFEDLSPAQQRAIILIVEGELGGVSLTRLLKTGYSCRYCGRLLGRSSQRADDRKRLKLIHEERECEFGPLIKELIVLGRDGEPPRKEERRSNDPVFWRFATSSSTFYNRWMRQSVFERALSQARREAREYVLGQAQHDLKVAATAAVAELRRQIVEGERDIDRRAAAVAILDRADVGTAPVVNDGVRSWLDALRAVEDD